MNKFFALLFSLLTLCGCSALSSALPVINSALTDTDIVLKGIDATFDAYQLGHDVSPTDRAEYARLLATAYRALSVGERAISDIKHVSQGQYDQAFTDFQTAYAALTGFLKSKGVTPAGAGLVGVGAAGGDDFPTPRVIGLRVAE